MYLKNLTLLGFKSFADKTTLNFQPGVTAIVGPNGCGKSNVSDAIRWVLGEQSAKALRGGEMADVIFNGTDGRKPLGMAEVSLTIGAVDQDHLQAAGVELAYDEVTLTRRVFRDGGSEYFINKTPCRLKDIQQLFMGTGVGRTSYSIMAQGNITQILSSKPEDRRLVFEEAAGITKFKSQKKEALRKLEYTEQNLLRISDLIREVKRQIGSLQRQAGKARRYKALLQQLQHLDTQLARHHFDVLQAEIRERSETSDRLKTAIDETTQSVLVVENEILQLRSRHSELEEQINHSQQHGLELKAQAERHESRIHFNEQRLLEFDDQHGQALSDIAQAEERCRTAQQELASVTERLTAADARLVQQRETLETRRAALQQVEADLRQQQDALRQAQADAFGLAQQLSRVRNEITALDLQKQGNIVRLEKLSAEKIQLEEERGRLEARLQDFAANVAAEKASAQSCRGTIEERQQRLRDLDQQIGEIAQTLESVLHQQAGARSRLHLLEQLESEHEGFTGGTLAALKMSDQVLGSLADRIRVPQEYVPAIEAALGHHLQLVLTEQPETAQQIIADLSSQKKGRASLAPLLFQNGELCAEVAKPPDAGATAEGAESAANAFSQTEDESATHASSNGHGVRATAVVEADLSVGPLVRRLLDWTRIVPDLAVATQAWRETQGAFHFVTHRGELLSRQGVYTGGSNNGNGQAPLSILGRKNQIAELRGQLAQLQEQVAEHSRRKGTLVSEQTELQASLRQAQNELRVQEVSIATHEGEFKALQHSLRLLHQKIDTVVYEIQSLAEQDQEGREKRAGLASRSSELEAQETARQQAIAELSAHLEALRGQRDTATGALTEAKVTVATEEQQCAAMRQQQPPLTQRIQELSQLAERRCQEIGVFAERKTQAHAEIDDSRRQIQRLHHEREVVNDQTSQLLAEKASQEHEISTREEDLRAHRRRLTEHQEQRSAVEVELAQKQMAVENLRERIQQKYQLRLDDIRSECITITIADEGPAQITTLTPEEMAAAGVATNWDAVAEQVDVLQKRLDELGPVNLVAIEEYEETEQRYNHLNTQYEDLVHAKQQLIEAITRINTQTREMFTETFNKIRESFRLMFVEIFGGGMADLQLVDDGDVLESGIEILARPPGKQLRAISLLSGGEQTMTAVALLFSIYQVKPSPFCVLDELDAPLDESNVNRFVRILKRFLDHSQFVIITHNKRTISMADVLYGVTMQEQGVSKIVSVKFHKGEETVTDHVAAPLEGSAGDEGNGGPPAKSRLHEEQLEVVMAK